MRVHTSYRTFKTAKRQEIIDITDDVEACRAKADVTEGMVLVSAMHISASVFVNDHEPGCGPTSSIGSSSASRRGSPRRIATTAAPARTTPRRTCGRSPSGTKSSSPVTAGASTSDPGSVSSMANGTVAAQARRVQGHGRLIRPLGQAYASRWETIDYAPATQVGASSRARGVGGDRSMTVTA
jgi:hypothetical protein